MKYIKNFILEAISRGDINDMVQSISDLGFKVNMYPFWAESGYTPFGDGKTTSLTEVTGWSKCYSIKVSKSGVNSEDTMLIFEEIQTAIDRLSDLGKVYPRISVRTSRSGVISASAEFTLIGDEVLEISISDNIKKILKENGYRIFEGRWYKKANDRESIFIHTQNRLSMNRYYSTTYLKKRRDKAISIKNVVDELLKDFDVTTKILTSLQSNTFSSDYGLLEIKIGKPK